MMTRIFFLILALFFSLPVQAVFTDDDFTRQITALRQRAIQAVDTAQPDTLYMQAKVDAWLDFAFEEHVERDTTGIAEDALQRAIQQVNWLEAKLPEGDFPHPIPPPTGEGSIVLSPSEGESVARGHIDRGLGADESLREFHINQIRGTVLVRENLWSAIDKLRQDPAGFPCTARYLGRTEVQLIRAGHEQPELGIRHARRYIIEAEQLLKEAEQLARACQQKNALPPDSPEEHADDHRVQSVKDSDDPAAAIKTDRKMQDADFQPGENQERVTD